MKFNAPYVLPRKSEKEDFGFFVRMSPNILVQRAINGCKLFTAIFKQKSNQHREQLHMRN
ncbi:hypothetical protein PHLCEN_2v2079 [Hermanssonia centrifuga]|uniref:Uncharacterized protein n=1 Tax=Hermanssonia centrifuga TaxID=98765 RepID=A0A2R6RQ63_9APHY|nr:hypothetical protein PHLCEN_2v2079 [Hermanssonia centrifuga]